MTVDEAVLYATDDAMIWAEEWCKVAREIAAADDGREVIDEGWMVGWYANAMETAKQLAFCWVRPDGSWSEACDRKAGHKGLHSWEVYDLFVRDLGLAR